MGNQNQTRARIAPLESTATSCGRLEKRGHHCRCRVTASGTALHICDILADRNAPFDELVQETSIATVDAAGSEAGSAQQIARQPLP
jgi:hypothetical protein